MILKSLLLVGVLVALTKSAAVRKEEEAGVCNLPQELVNEIASYRDVAERIIETATVGKLKGSTYNELAYFVDKFGPRISGSRTLENAIDFMLDKLQAIGLDNVHGEEVKVPHWVRGEESATVVRPRTQKLSILGLGSSVGTPPGGILAEAIVVTSFDELDQRKDEVAGKIVVFVPEWVGYGETVHYRSESASRASKYGAVAALVRSMASFSISSPHAGQQDYLPGVVKIPVAAIAVENANFLKRVADRGEQIIIHLVMNAKTLPEEISRNTIAELQGTEQPEKVVIVSGHLDSWDVGQGAMDDGGGAFISWNSLVVLKELGLRPKRTIRAILWTAEEPGYVGAYGYAREHTNELNNTVFALESDEGTFNPLGLGYNAGVEGGCILAEIVKLLESINATRLEKAPSVGSDIEVLQDLGVPGGSLLNADDKYFWFHHSNGDQLDVEDAGELDRGTALFSVVSYVIADLSVDFPRKS